MRETVRTNLDCDECVDRLRASIAPDDADAVAGYRGDVYGVIEGRELRLSRLLAWRGHRLRTTLRVPGLQGRLVPTDYGCEIRCTTKRPAALRILLIASFVLLVTLFVLGIFGALAGLLQGQAPSRWSFYVCGSVLVVAYAGLIAGMRLPGLARSEFRMLASFVEDVCATSPESTASSEQR